MSPEVRNKDTSYSTKRTDVLQKMGLYPFSALTSMFQKTILKFNTHAEANVDFDIQQIKL